MNHIIIKLGNQEYILKNRLSAFILFEEMVGKCFQDMEETMGNNLRLFYCMLKANNRETFTFSFDDFLSLLDDDGGKPISDFNCYLMDFSKAVVPAAKGTNFTPPKRRRKK